MSQSATQPAELSEEAMQATYNAFAEALGKLRVERRIAVEGIIKRMDADKVAELTAQLQ